MLSQNKGDGGYLPLRVDITSSSFELMFHIGDWYGSCHPTITQLRTTCGSKLSFTMKTSVANSKHTSTYVFVVDKILCTLCVARLGAHNIAVVLKSATSRSKDTLHHLTNVIADLHVHNPIAEAEWIHLNTTSPLGVKMSDVSTPVGWKMM